MSKSFTLALVAPRIFFAEVYMSGLALRSALWSGVALICMRDLTDGLPRWFSVGLVLFWIALVLWIVASQVVLPLLLRELFGFPIRLTLRLPLVLSLPLVGGPVLGWMAVGTFWLWLTLQFLRR